MTSIRRRHLESGRTSRAWRNRLFKVAMLCCMFVAFGTLVVLLADTLITGWPALSQQLLTGLPSTARRRRERGRRSSRRSISGCSCSLFSVPIGVLTAIYLEEYADRERWWNRADRGQHPEPRRGARDRVRDPRAGVHRPRDRRRPGRPRRRAHSHAGRAPDGRRRPPARRSARSRTRSARAPSRSGRRSGRWSGARCCRPRSRESRQARSSRSRGRSARLRR